MARALVRYEPAPKKAAVPKPQTWKLHLKRPWSSTCDARAVASVVIHLHFQSERGCYVTIGEIVDWILLGDYVDLPALRRADVKEAFSDRNDILDIVSLLVAYLAGEGVLIPEYEHDGETYQMNPDEVTVLHAAHVNINHRESPTAHLRVV